MDKEWYRSEMEALQRQLLATQRTAIDRGNELIVANMEIMRLKQELYECKQARQA